MHLQKKSASYYSDRVTCERVSTAGWALFSPSIQEGVILLSLFSDFLVRHRQGLLMPIMRHIYENDIEEVTPNMMAHWFNISVEGVRKHLRSMKDFLNEYGQPNLVSTTCLVDNIYPALYYFIVAAMDYYQALGN